MLSSIGLILILGLALGILLDRLNWPRLIGYMLIGILIGPNLFNLIHGDLLNITDPIKSLALVTLLLRASLSIEFNKLKTVARPALLMGLLPASFEILTVLLVAPLLLKISYLEAAIMGTVVAAVSPAIIFPSMLKIMSTTIGKQSKLPGLILSAASLDGFFILLLFSSFMSIANEGSFSILSLLTLPLSILSGIGLGVILGLIASYLFKHTANINKNFLSIEAFFLLAVAILIFGMEAWIQSSVPFSGLLAILSLGITVQIGLKEEHTRLTGQTEHRLNVLWQVAEIFLFVLLGASIQLKDIATSTNTLLPILLLALLARLIAVYLALLKTTFSQKEKLFAMLSFIPKATVQAAIGAIPLSLGLASGDQILSLSILAILITAPVGSILIQSLYPKLLAPDKH